MSQTKTVTITIVDEAADTERLEADCSTLRRELLDLGVDDVEPVSGGRGPEGTRAIDPALVGTLTVVFQTSLPIVTGIVGVIATWLGAARGGRAVELTVGDRTLKLASANRTERDQLVTEFLANVASHHGQSPPDTSVTP